MVIARHLDIMGWQVRVWLIGDRNSLSTDCRTNLAILERSEWKIGLVCDGLSPMMVELVADMKASTVMVDAMLGTGSKGPLRQAMSEVVRAANQVGALRIAVDQPTGMDAQTGEVYDPCIQAAVTYTFVAKKPGLLCEKARQVVGDLIVISIGIPRSLIAAMTAV